MCGLCGVFGMSSHWSDNAADAGSEDSRKLPDRVARAHRLRIAQRMLKPFRLSVREWTGGYIVATSTGKSAVIDNLGALWQEAEKLTGRVCDPLDERYLGEV
jgi:hypothetical protein